MWRALAFALTMLAGPAFADSASPPPGGVAQRADGGLEMSSQICAALAGGAAAVPGADYLPGVDANGNAVAPADLPSSAQSPAVDNFPIEIDRRLAGKFNLPKTGGIGGKAILGYVTLRGNRAYFNGQPLNADQNAALAEACRDAKR
ncbi:MAG TPA: hypothetical protein VNF99_04035 [Stellaceae bacterium]|nr:hypothetical protein [Stellaceae bacterium]